MAKITSSQFFGIEEPQSSLSQRLSSIGNIDDIYTDTNASRGLTSSQFFGQETSQVLFKNQN